MSRFDVWINRAHFFLGLLMLPITLTRNESEMAYALAILVMPVWVPLMIIPQLILCLPALFCGFMAMKYLKR